MTTQFRADGFFGKSRCSGPVQTSLSDAKKNAVQFLDAGAQAVAILEQVGGLWMFIKPSGFLAPTSAHARMQAIAALLRDKATP